MNGPDINRRANAVVFLLGVLHALECAGRFPPGVPITPAGVALFDQLDADGFRLTREEGERAVRDVARLGLAKVDDGAVTTLARVAADWDRIKQGLAAEDAAPG